MPAGVLFLTFVLGLFFLATGGLKLTVPHEVGKQRIGWVDDVAPARYRLAGWFEVLGGIGLMFPTMVQAAEWLTPLASAGLLFVMVAATFLHVGRGEMGYAAGTVGLAALLLIVAVSAVLA